MSTTDSTPPSISTPTEPIRGPGHRTDSRPRSIDHIRLVAVRELRALLLSRMFLVGAGFTVAVVIAGFALSALFPSEPLRVGILGPQPPGAVETLLDGDGDVAVVELAPGTDPADALDRDDLDAVVVDGTEIVMAERDDGIVARIGGAWAEARLVDGLTGAGVAPEVVADAIAPLSVTELDPDTDRDTRVITGFVTVLILFVAIQMSGAYIMMGIMEEKGTRIVELLLSSIKARDLLLGKVLGVGIVGLIQIILLVTSFVVAAAVTGRDVPSLQPATLAIGVAFFVVGYLLFGSLFAAGASLAPSQQDAQAALAPVSLVTMLSYFGAAAASAEPGSSFARIISFVPTVAPFAIPSRFAADEASGWDVAIGLAVAAATTAVVFQVAARVYVRSVMHTDRKLGWLEAWKLDR